MRKILLMLCLFTIASVSVSYADQFLAADFVEGVSVSEVEVNGIVQSGITQLTADGTKIKLLNISGLPSGSHTFRARWHDGSGWWSDWSVPLSASRLGAPGLRIVDE